MELGYDYIGIFEQVLKYHAVSAIATYLVVNLLVLSSQAQRYAVGGLYQLYAMLSLILIVLCSTTRSS